MCIRDRGSAGWLVAVWLLTGFMTLTAALSYGELSAMFPKAGGQYVYLKESYNPLLGFLYGWSFFSVIQTGTIAAVGVAFSKFAGYFFPSLEMTDANILLHIGFLKIYPAQLLSIAIIILLTYINTKGVQGGKLIQTTFTVTKLASLFGLIGFGFLLASKSSIWNSNWENAWAMKSIAADNSSTPIFGVAILGAIAASMVGSIFSSDAWNNVTFIAGEIKNPKRNIGLSLFLGTLIVTVIYISANLMYLSVLPLHEIANAPADRVAVAASNVIFGNIGTYVIAVMIMISTFGCNNGIILAGGRLFQAMANDRLFFKKAAETNDKDVPVYSLGIQGLWAILLCFSGSYGALLDFTVFAILIFYFLTVASVFKTRIMQNELPLLQKLLFSGYLILLVGIAGNLLWVKTLSSSIGLGIVLLGIPFYFVMKKTQSN